MTTGRDALSVLAAADPARSRAPFDPASERGQVVLRRAMALVAEADAEPRRRSPVRGRGRRRLWSFVAVGMAAAAAGAAAYVNTREPDRVLGAGCYSATTGTQKIYFVSTQKDTAVDACWDVWRAGKFAPLPTPARLVACVDEGGGLGVYPGGPETCARLRADPAPDDVRAAPELVALSEELAKAVQSSKCLGRDEARRLGREALDRVGLRDWPVGASAEPFSAAKPCAGFLIDEADDRLVLIPQGAG